MPNMIRIEYQRDKNSNISYLSLKGHAGSDEYGKDLVCAAVSAIITGGLNAIRIPKTFDIKFAEGDVEVKALDNVLNDDYKTLEVILIQLLTVASKEKNYVKIVEKGN